MLTGAPLAARPRSSAGLRGRWQGSTRRPPDRRSVARAHRRGRPDDSGERRPTLAAWTGPRSGRPRTGRRRRRRPRRAGRVHGRARHRTALDLADPLAPFRDRFVIDDPTWSTSTATRSGGCRWPPSTALDARPRRVGRRPHPRLGRLARLAAARRRPARRRACSAPGPARTVVADSTTVNIYRLAAAALDARPGRRDDRHRSRDDFPTDRYILEGLADARGLEIRWLDGDPVDGPTPADIAAALDDDVALVLLSPRQLPLGGDRRHGGDHGRRPRRRGARRSGTCRHSAGAIPVELEAQRCRPRGRLHVQVPQRRARARPRSCTSARELQARAPQPDPGLVRAARPVRDGPGLRAGSRASAAGSSGPRRSLGLAAVEEGVGDRRRGRHRGDPGQGRSPSPSTRSRCTTPARAARLHDRQSARHRPPRRARLDPPSRRRAPVPRADRRAASSPTSASRTRSASAWRRCTRASSTSGTASTACASCWSAAGDGLRRGVGRRDATDRAVQRPPVPTTTPRRTGCSRSAPSSWSACLR